MPSVFSSYSAGSFYFTRISLSISTLIVTGILVYFAVHLHSDGYKLPYALLILLITCFLTLLNLAFTGILFCRNSLHPVVSMIFNIIIFLLWALSLGVLGYSMKGTLATTCDASNWGTSTGIMVCRLYKTLFSFIVISLVVTFFHIILDIIARRDRHNMSRFGSMRRDYGEDIKLHERNESSVPALATGHSLPPVPPPENVTGLRADAYNAFGAVRPEAVPLQQRETGYHHGRENDYGNTANSYRDGFEHESQQQHHVESNEYYDGVPDIPAPGPRWATGASPYSPLHSRFDEQQQVYESYRPRHAHSQ
ncbi:hypothetical protein BGW36DRAFT_421602 [Talaromyces proteolyticus]|uniref:MARVEL domain-containing protein n=1 Tax=Talaromyces proteolyticus TaxID=1131652 RepID=A0AAD4Q0Y6_9EURO|nr:uncharacterized protein BGW36DRAFT_421602 [Talaromyces proteolyticus]KAH8705025.1 hypothetical protein BGW36DRAFT_421602 [Talaromyces proteolyticus]